MKLNLIGLISAILAFISIALPWYSVVGPMSEHDSLLVFVSTAGGIGGTSIGVLWFIYVALAFLIIGGLLGLIGSLIIGKNGKNLLVAGGALVLLSPIIFAVGWATSVIASVLPLFGSIGAYTVFVSFGFFLALIAGILLFISTRKHPMEAGVPLAPVAPPPPQ